MSEMYPRPRREEIAARHAAQQPGTANEPAPGADSPLANFSLHLSARMRALGWDQADLQERGGVGPHVAAKAINGTGCDLAVAGRLAVLVGGYLAAMIGPYLCSTCHGEPPAGYSCLECAAETRAS